MTANKKNTDSRSFASGSWLISLFLHITIILLLLFTTGRTISNSLNKTPPARIITMEQPQQLQAPVLTETAISPTSIPLILPEAQTGPALADISAITPLTITRITPSASQKSLVQAEIPKSIFFGTSGQGQCICYLVDVSGSMIMAIEYIKKELVNSISQLKPDQYFQIVFYGGEKPESFAQDKLTRASFNNRQQAVAFINGIDVRRAISGVEPWRPLLNALHAGFDSRTFDQKTANLIYLFTDGDFDDKIIMPVLETIQQNQRPSASINVILCGSINNEEKLKNLANKYKGQYQFLTDEELVNPSRTSQKNIITDDIFEP